MKLRSALLAFAGVLVFSLTACQKKAKEPTDTTTLSFMQEDKVRVDIMDELGITFNYGDETVVSGQELTIVEDQVFTYTGEMSTNNINFIAFVEKTNGNDIFWYDNYLAGIFLDLQLPYFKLNGIKKIYIAISTGEIKWANGLSEGLDQAFTERLNSVQE